jgi:ABC-type branched-subunit amino acid transport system substrate-binding protein
MKFVRKRLLMEAIGICLVGVMLTYGGGITMAKESSAEGSKSPYVVSIITSLTGGGADAGTAGAGGFQAVFDRINASGGINGHKIQIQLLDDQSSVAGSENAARSAEAQNPVAIMDAASSADFVDRMPTFESAKVPVLAVNGTSVGLWPWLYSDGLTANQLAVTYLNAVASLSGGSLKGKKVGYVGADVASDVATNTIVESLIAKRGGSISTTQLLPLGSPSFDSGAATVVASGAKSVISVDSGPDTIVEAKALFNAGFKGPIVGNQSASDPLTIQTIDSPQYYAITQVGSAVPGSTMYKTAKQFKLAQATSNNNFGLGWGLAYMLVDGLKKCGFPCAPASLEKSLNSLGTMTIPGGAFPFGAPHVSKAVHNVLTKIQLSGWSAANSTVVKKGNPVSVGAPGYPPRQS